MRSPPDPAAGLPDDRSPVAPSPEPHRSPGTADAHDSAWADEGNRPPVEVASVGNRTEADLIVGLLLSNGIGAAVESDDAGGQQPQWQLSGVRVLVAAADAETARAVLAEQRRTNET
jgi:hypothetical protein